MKRARRGQKAYSITKAVKFTPTVYLFMLWGLNLAFIFVILSN